MKKNWYKVLGVLILVYSFIVGMIVPLSPGISNVEPRSVQTGEHIQLEVSGYNSHFEQGKADLRAWLKIDSTHFLKAVDIKVLSDNAMNINFEIPQYLPISERVAAASLILDNPVDGASTLPSAVFITQDSINPSKVQAELFNHPPSDIHERAFMTFPFRNILQETIRNLYFHVSLWFALMLLLGAAVYNAVVYLIKKEARFDVRSTAFTQVGLLFGILGLVTGAIWAQYTWGQAWSWDIKQNATAIALLIYAAYFVLRNSLEDEERKARLAATYSIFAYVALIILLYVIPRMTDSSLHPGNGGNPGFGGEDLDNTMRTVFYPAIIGWTLIGVWVASLLVRAERLKQSLLED